MIDNAHDDDIIITKRSVARFIKKNALHIEGVRSLGWQCYGWWGRILWFLGFTGIKIRPGESPKITIPLVISEDSNAREIALDLQNIVSQYIRAKMTIEKLSVDVNVIRVERG